MDITIKLDIEEANAVSEHLQFIRAVAAGFPSGVYGTNTENYVALWDASPLGKLNALISEQLREGSDDYSKSVGKPDVVHPFCPKLDANGVVLQPGDHVVVAHPNHEAVRGKVVISDTLRSKCEDGTLAPALVVKPYAAKGLINPKSADIIKAEKVYAVGTKQGGMYAGPDSSLANMRQIQGQNHGDCLYEFAGDEYTIIGRWHAEKGKWLKVKPVGKD